MSSVSRIFVAGCLALLVAVQASTGLAQDAPAAPAPAASAAPGADQGDLPPLEQPPPELPFTQAPASSASATQATPATSTTPTTTPARLPPSRPAGLEDTIVVESPYERPHELGLNPGTPHAPGALSLGVSDQAPGVEAEPGYRFQFHGYLSVPLAVGVEPIAHPAPGQGGFALHTPPQVADTWGSFSYANVVPGPWVQLNLSYGNPTVTGTVVVAAYTISSASAWFNPSAQLGIDKAFLTFDLPVSRRIGVLARVGAFGNSYGQMAEYDNGRYETPLVATTGGVGGTVTAEYRHRQVEIQLEDGFAGLLDIAPAAIRQNSYTGSSATGSHGISTGSSLCPTDPPRTAAQEQDANNQAALLGSAYGWPDCNVGSGFVHHTHLGFGWAKRVHVTLHWLHAFSRDDRTPELPPVQLDPNKSLPARAQPAGNIDVYAAEIRVPTAHLGYLYLGANRTRLVDASTVGGIINVLNAGGGPGLSRFYFGPQSRGNGSLWAFGAQYDLSVARLLRYPASFYGDAPDVTVSVFGMHVRASSPDPTYDGKQGLKAGTEVAYSPLRWLVLDGRYDWILPNLGQHGFDRQIVTARIAARTTWLSRERVWLQYSHWFNGSQVLDPYTNLPPTDHDLVALVGTLWW